VTSTGPRAVLPVKRSSGAPPACAGVCSTRIGMVSSEIVSPGPTTKRKRISRSPGGTSWTVSFFAAVLRSS